MTRPVLSVTTGEDDPKAASNALFSLRSDLASKFNKLAWDLPREYERIGSDQYTTASDERWKMSQIESDLRYGNDFYGALIQAHNSALALKRAGVFKDDEESLANLNTFIQLNDPTILHFTRLLFFYAANAVKHMSSGSMSALRKYDFWSMIEAEKAIADKINNPNYITPKPIQ